MKIIIIGGGAAGFFTAVTIVEKNPQVQVTILERGKDVLQKVKISGGGRCNVTHACFNNRDLVKNYPRGEKALMSPFSRFSAQDTIDWFKKHGVQLKTESDGRMFPTSDNSQTIIDCLYGAAIRGGVKILRGYRAESIQTVDNQFIIKTPLETFTADKVVIAAGSSNGMWDLIRGLGHTIVSPVPSLFTFNIKDERIKDLAGLSVSMAQIEVEGLKLSSNGPLLITHWGLSGPAILRLSAWGARLLFEKKYQFTIKINWTGFETLEDVKETLNQLKIETAKKNISNTPLFNIPNRLWQRFLTASSISTETKWADLNKKQLLTLAEQLTQCRYEVNGKSTFKDEFVTAGGVNLDEVNFKTFESKLIPNLYFAGEILDIDAITGGFNFQAAWTGGWIVGNAILD